MRKFPLGPRFHKVESDVLDYLERKNGAYAWHSMSDYNAARVAKYPTLPLNFARCSAIYALTQRLDTSYRRESLDCMFKLHQRITSTGNFMKAFERKVRKEF